MLRMSSPAVGSASPGPTSDDQDSAAARMSAVVHRLAADEFTGRRVGTPGGRAAAAWLATHLESLGAQVHTDTFTVSGAMKELTATPTLRWGGRDLVHRRDFAEHLASTYTPDPAEGAWGTGPILLRRAGR